MQFAPSPSLFFTKYFFGGQNTVFSLSEYCFWFLKVGISALKLGIYKLVFKCINSTLSLLCSELGQKQDIELHRNHSEGMVRLS